jgi:hypothetical protein
MSIIKLADAMSRALRMARCLHCKGDLVQLKYLALALQRSGGAKPYASSSDLEGRSRKEDRVLDREILMQFLPTRVFNSHLDAATLFHHRITDPAEICENARLEYSSLWRS